MKPSAFALVLLLLCLLCHRYPIPCYLFGI